jgi:hypothetical protein
MRFVMTTRRPTMLMILDKTVMVRRDKILSTSSPERSGGQNGGFAVSRMISGHLMPRVRCG